MNPTPDNSKPTYSQYKCPLCGSRTPVHTHAGEMPAPKVSEVKQTAYLYSCPNSTHEFENRDGVDTCKHCFSAKVSEPSENNNKEITTMNKTTTRAKFSCKSIDQTDDTHRIKFEPVFSGSDENRDFFKWTPGGSIDLQVVGNDTAAQFQVGHDYYVDFSDAE
jgi:hypothetical protein